jgi:hypothetical protein
MNGEQWVVWYDDTTSFSWEQGQPHLAPRWGVICVVERSAEHGRIIWVGHDYYWWHPEGWAGGDLTGLLDYVTQPILERVVLVGRSVPATRHHRVYKMALDDPRLPVKTSVDWLEQHDDGRQSANNGV